MSGEENEADATAAGRGRPDPAPAVQLAKRPAEEYLDGVRAALADLPEPEVGEILEDVRAHLADLAEELGEATEPVGLAALTARLGTPAAYAAELRTAAGYPQPPRPDSPPGHALGRLALLGLVCSTLLTALGGVAVEPGAITLGALLALAALAVVVRDGPLVPRVAALPEVRRILGARPAEGSAPRAALDFVAGLQPAWGTCSTRTGDRSTRPATWTAFPRRRPAPTPWPPARPTRPGPTRAAP